jgi:dephospho-CoA kinase
VRSRFGDDAIGPSGAVDRAVLGPRAFAEEGGLAFLEALVHPRVQSVRRDWIAAERGRDAPPALLVCEVPVLFEAGIADQFDAVLVVTASDAVRRARVTARGQDFEQRSARQIPEREKVARADGAYVNDGDLAALRAWVADRYAEYSGRSCHASLDPH